MFSNVLRITYCALFLQLLPLLAYFTGWSWQPDQQLYWLADSWWLKTLFWSTETVTMPWGMLTSLILSLLFAWCLKLSKKQTVLVIGLFFTVLLLGQGLKTVIKDTTKEARPYMTWLQEQHVFTLDGFSELSRIDKTAMVNQAVGKLPTSLIIPVWLSDHWAFETGYALPSGHTLFASTWALFAFGLLLARGWYKTTILVICWAIAVLASRLALGMHLPRDLFLATSIAWILVTPACCWLEYKGILSKPIKRV